jgi:ADP-ribose pyrophosphatase YjhB (NUDIX family)
MIKFCSQCGTPVEEQLFEGKLRPTCPQCHYVAFADPKVAATVLVEYAGKLLLVRRGIEPARGLWCFPGGYVDFGEDPVAAAVRECREEARVVVTDLVLLDVSFNGRVIAITYQAVANSDAAAPGDDADLAAWFLPSQLPPIAFTSVERAIAIWQARRNPQLA